MRQAEASPRASNAALRVAGTHRRAVRPHRETFALRPLVLALACAAAGGAGAQIITPTTLPVPSVPLGGAVSLSSLSTASRMVINQATQRAIIDWTSFSIGRDAAVQFVQPNAASIVLNRVALGPTATQSVIDGSLSANGRVFLVNPSGVLFGSTSQVNVGGLIASALALQTSDADFLNPAVNRFVFKDPAPDDGPRYVTNEGTIKTTASGGTVALIGSVVENYGEIVATGGTAALVGAETVTVDLAGDGLTNFTLSRGYFGGVYNAGALRADGGRAALLANGGKGAGGVVNSGGVVQAQTLGTRNGEIVLDAGGTDQGVRMYGGTLSASGEAAGETGGSITLRGGTVLVDGNRRSARSLDSPAALAVAPPQDDQARILANGPAGGGRIRIEGGALSSGSIDGAVAVGGDAIVEANATASGKGGDIRLLGERQLQAYGSLSARGGPNGGDGGFIETSGGYAVGSGDPGGGGVDLRGLRVDAGAPRGKAGTWLVDPFEVRIVPGAGAPPLDNPFEPIADSLVQDGDINAALNKGTSVRITTGAPGSGAPDLGDIFIQDRVRIVYDQPLGPVTLQLDANRSVRSGDNVVIASTNQGGPLDVIFNADANGFGAAVGGGQISFGGSIYTNGGNVAMSGRWSNESNTTCSVCLTGPVIDTRGGNTSGAGFGGFSGGQDFRVGGNVRLTGITTGPGTGEFTAGAVVLEGTRIFSSSGAVTLLGTSTTDSGVQLSGGQLGPSGIFTTSGAVSITGVGSYAQTSASAPGHGVVLDGAVVQTTGGNVAVHGRRLAGGATDGNGVLLRNGASIAAGGTGDIEVTGQSGAGAAGLLLGAGSKIDGNRNVTLRAGNLGASDAVDLSGTVRAANALDLRPGAVTAGGDALDATTGPITIGGASALGFAVSSAELGRLTTTRLVLGSSTHAGDIVTVGPLSLGAELTLQNPAGGRIALGGPVATPRLGLVSAGEITQAPGASITASSLLARSTGSAVTLREPLNDVGTVGGDAATAFAYVDRNALTLGPVTATGFDAATNLPQALAAGTTRGDSVFVRTLAGDLTLAAPVTSKTGTDLIAAARFQNPANATIGGGRWRIWADTWVGETRGGLAGSGPLPNLYHCAFSGLCTVTVPAADNHFIYAQQPTVTVTIADASRLTTDANPPFNYGVTGLILGDTGSDLAGAPSTTATAGSPAGTYAINGTFTSAAGYAVKVVPGLLTVSTPPITPIDPPITPIDPPITPIDPPITPIDPPITPIDPPITPIDPPITPIDPPITPPRFPTDAFQQRALFASIGQSYIAERPRADVVRDLPSTWLYDRNIGQAPICFATGPLDGDRALQGTDLLAREWARVRSRPNLTSCVDTE
ncbi:MAG: filamentous hemagglutinin N-terminal domain-containing protein, partial [Comamonadaceae bacterium]